MNDIIIIMYKYYEILFVHSPQGQHWKTISFNVIYHSVPNCIYIYIEIVQGVPVFFVSDEIVCTPFITTHGTNSVHYTLFFCI